MKVGQKAANWLGIQDPGNKTVVTSLGFLLASHLLELMLKKSATQRNQKAQPKKVPASLFSLANRPKERKPNKTRKFQTVTTLLQPTIKKKPQPKSPHANESQVGSLDFQPYQSASKYPSSPTKVVKKKTKFGNRTSPSVCQHGVPPLTMYTHSGCVRRA